MLRALTGLHDAVFGGIERLTRGWFLGLFSRFVFASVLLLYFWNSALTKIGSGFAGIFSPALGAYAQIIPPIAEQYNYNADAIPFFPWKLIVLAGTYAEFVLPALIVVGLFTRLASLGMIGFVAVMTYVDIAFHGADPTAVGALFDRVQDSAIADQRLLWLVPLLVLVVKGPGWLSLDALIGRFFRDEPL